MSKAMYLNNVSFTAVFVEDPQGGYSAYVEEIPGANSQGETLEEAKENLKDAWRLKTCNTRKKVIWGKMAIVYYFKIWNQMKLHI